MIKLTSPDNTKDKARYYHFRWEHLRAPWGQPQGSEQDELENVSYHFMLTDKDNDIIAVARLHQVNGCEGQVRYVAVCPKKQGQGLGRKIMLACEQKAISLGLSQITLNARENALTFYDVLGYQNLGKSHVLYDEVQHFSMLKQLTTKPLSPSVEELVKTLHATIPMSKAMDINVVQYDENILSTSCDLLFNKNLHNTMFAGSINTLATLTGWGWVYLKLKQLECDGDIVLAKSNIKYLSPIPSFAHAIIKHTNVDESYQRLNSKKKTKMTLTCQVYSGDILAAEFNGTYVVLPKRNKND